MPLRRSRRRWALASVPVVLASMVVMSTPASAAVTPFGVRDFRTGFNNSFNLSPAKGAPLLSEFFFSFQNGDHHLKGIKARAASSGFVNIGFTDTNGDDRYLFDVAWQWIDPPTNIVLGSTSGNCRARCSLNLDVPRPSENHIFVLTGFEVLYTDGDRHFDALGFEANATQVLVFYSDDSNDDSFTTTVQYAWVHKDYFQQFNRSIFGTVRGAGSDVQAVERGPKVISGFSFGAFDDNHVRDIGINTNLTDIEVVLSDNNPADSGDWQYSVKYAVLR